MNDRVARFVDQRWVAQMAIQPFLGTKEDPPPDIGPPPILDGLGIETAEERFDRMADEHVPIGARQVGGTLVYNLDGGQGTWIFRRDEREFDEKSVA